MSRFPVKAALLLVLQLFLVSAAHAATLLWDPNTEPDLQGYRVYSKRLGDANYTLHANVGTTVTNGSVRYTLPTSSFPAGQTFMFAVKAYDTSNNESVFSNEVQFTMPNADSDGDGVVDSSDCAPSDNTRWRNGSFYDDPDGDGIRTSNIVRTVCYGNSTPAGYTPSPNGPVDNCPDVSNANQLNTDGVADGGDACDLNDDNDANPDSSDCAPTDSSRWRSATFYPDADNDGVRTNSTASTICYGAAAPTGYTTNASGSDCAPTDATRWQNFLVAADADRDNIPTNQVFSPQCGGATPPLGYTTNSNGGRNDNCVNIANTSQTNTDGDSQGDACDTDDDNDGRADTVDNCPLVSNANQLDTNNDGIGDACQQIANPDTDGDGLTDADERNIHGTDPTRADTDSDRVSDSQEITDGSKPTDRGSFLTRRATQGCLPWNGFFAMWNVSEFVNVSNRRLNVTAALYAIDGTVRSSKSFAVEPGAQYDLLVHDLAGRGADSIGTLCYAHDGAVSDLDGAMVFYKVDSLVSPAVQSRTATIPMEFTVSTSFNDGLTGRQVVGINTFDPDNLGRLVANWINITNRSAVRIEGTLEFRGMDGALLGSESLSLAPAERRDLSGHQFGANIVGYVAWTPGSADARVQMNNVRYIYDNGSNANHFETAFQLEGRVGSGEALVLPVDRSLGSSILEISNTLEKAVTASVAIYNGAGVLVFDQRIELSAYATRHIITDTLVALGDRGIAVVDGSDAESIVAVEMAYNRRANGRVTNMRGVPGIEPLGSVLSGSYNTFLGQNGLLLLLNRSGKSTAATLSMARSDGTRLGGTSSEGIVLGSPITVPAHGIKVINVKDYEETDRYGVVTLQAETNALVSWMLRVGNDYVMPTPVRE